MHFALASLWLKTTHPASFWQAIAQEKVVQGLPEHDVSSGPEDGDLYRTPVFFENCLALKLVHMMPCRIPHSKQRVRMDTVLVPIVSRNGNLFCFTFGTTLSSLEKLMKELFTLELFALNSLFVCPNSFSSILES